MQHLLCHQYFEKGTLSSLPAPFRSAISNNNLVPVSLRHTIFSLLHASPTVGHMGEYKTLYCIKLRFF